MSFRVGDIVRIVASEQTPSLLTKVHDKQEGEIVAVTAGSLYPFVVRLGNSTRLGFKESELEPVEAPGTEDDPVDHPSHYTWLPNGVEVIDITSHFNFALGNALKYIMRSEHKNDALEDLKKARWYLDYEIKQRESA
ncbi:DUF3310 domain-containing protein [Streptomyces sp. NPDC003444]